MLPLTEIKDWHNGSFFVLRGVSAQDICYEFFVLGSEFEGDGGVVVGSIAVLRDSRLALRFVCA